MTELEESVERCREAWKQHPEATWAWCCHHEIELEPLLEPASNRIDYILSDKPVHEQVTRLNNFRPVLSKLPETQAFSWAEYVKAEFEHNKACAEYDKAGAEYYSRGFEYHKIKTRAEYDKTRAEYVKAGAEYHKAEDEYNKARAEYVKAGAEYHKAEDEYNKAWDKYHKVRAEHSAELSILHKIDVPEHTWNDGSILER